MVRASVSRLLSKPSSLQAIWLTTLLIAGNMTGLCSENNIRDEHFDKVALSAIKPIAPFSIDGEMLWGNHLSGLATMESGFGIVVSDEGGKVQKFILDSAGHSLRIVGTENLMEKGNRPVEGDFEAAAYDKGKFYVIGSHGTARKSGVVQKSRHCLFCIEVDTNKHPQFTDGSAAGASKVIQTNVDNFIKGQKEIAWAVGKPLQLRGVNIEGLVVKDDKMFVGLRAPNIDGFCHVIETPVANVFTDQDADLVRLHSLKVGAGYGIRELTKFQDGFLLILGNSTPEPSAKQKISEDYDADRPFVLAFWQGEGAEILPLGTFIDPPGKPEALAVLAERQDTFDILVIFDGVMNGGPMSYSVEKPSVLVQSQVSEPTCMQRPKKSIYRRNKRLRRCFGFGRGR